MVIIVRKNVGGKHMEKKAKRYFEKGKRLVLHPPFL